MKQSTFLYILYGGLALVAAAIISVNLAAAATPTGTAPGPGWGMMGLGGAMTATTPAQAAAAQATEFQNEANATGLPLADIIAGWAQGQTLAQIAQANGITTAQLQTDLQNFRTQQVKDTLAALVANGTITQAQADQRLQVMASKPAKMGMMVKPGMRRGKVSTSTSSGNHQ